MNKFLIKRGFLSLIGVLLISFAIALLRKSNLGTDTFSCLNLGILNHVNYSFGTIQMTVNIILFIPIILFGRKYIGLGTILNMVLVGYISDFCLANIFSNSNYSLIVRILLLILGLLICSFGVAMYCVADFGIAPYDALGFIIEPIIKYKLNYGKLRIIQDSIFLISGLLLGSTLGIGTIIFALFTGPTVDFFKTKMIKWYKL